MRARRALPPTVSILVATRVAVPPGVNTITFEEWMLLSRSAMPPLTCLEGFGRVCFLLIMIPSTRSLPVRRLTSSTRPVFPLSLPVITLTVSFFLMRMRIGSLAAPRFPANPPRARGMLDHLRSKRNDLHEFLIAQLAGHRPEDARSHRLADLVDQHRRVRIEPDVGSVAAPGLLTHSNDHTA